MYLTSLTVIPVCQAKGTIYTNHKNVLKSEKKKI